MKLIAEAFTILGCLLIAGLLESANVNISLSVILTGVAGGIFYALYTILTNYALERYNAITVSTYTFAFALLGVLPFIDLPDIFFKLGNQSNVSHFQHLSITSLSRFTTQG